jgi:transcriptional regulator with XRE-family HTH domain
MPIERDETTIGATIAQLRKERKLSQAALARQAGISASAIAMYETGRRTPDKEAVKKLASALRVRMSAIASPSAQSSQTDALAEPLRQQQTRPKTTAQPAVHGASADNQTGHTQLALSLDEARVILFLRMNPQTMPFFQSYIAANNRRRDQLERAWRLIHEFQPTNEPDL